MASSYVVKRLGKFNVWTPISLIKQDGHFYGEAQFSSRAEALEYLKLFKERLRKHFLTPGRGGYTRADLDAKYKVFKIDGKLSKD